MNRYCFWALLLWQSTCCADVRLPKIINSQMVLQRDTQVQIWGWADPGEKIQVAGDWFDQAATATTDACGRWSVRLQTGKPDGPHTLTITGQNCLVLEDILFGEVWIASGQSNMEMPITNVSGAYTGIQDAEREIQQADQPQIRLFQVGNFSSKEPLDDVETGISMYGIPPAKCRWQVCTPTSIATFSSTAYFFARHLQSTLDVPVGIIDASWGGTSAEAWTPASGLQKLKYNDELTQATQLPQKSDQKIPTRLYNGMIHPLRHLTTQGVIWYQGEGNVGRADKYHQLFATMIHEWRQVLGCNLSFYFVQLAPFDYRKLNAALLREAQLQTMSVPNTGMAVTLDIGNLRDIHPKNKQEVGRRLALWALAKDYGHPVVFSGPIYERTVVENGTLRLLFQHADGGLATHDDQAPSHFEIAGDDQVFHPATARIDGETVIVSSPDVPTPKAVRYAFASEAMPNLVNKAGLPASSFRTDPW